MSAKIDNITIEQGADFSYPVSLLVSGSVPMDLTGWQAKSQIRKSYASLSVVGEMRVSGSMDTSGAFTLYLTPADTLALQPIVGVWDLIIFNSQDTERLLQGSATISPCVTRK